MKIHFVSLRKASVISAFAAVLLPATSHAAWTSLTLPNLSQDFASYQSANLSDGRFVYGSTNSLSLQTTFGSAALTSYSNAGSWDPSGVAIESNTLGAVSQGTFGASSIYTFNPSNPATSFTAIPGVTLQNYAIAFHDATSLFVDGKNGSLGGNSIHYVTLNGATNKIIIDNISTYSSGFALDSSGNLYVADDDNLKLYKFTAAQLNSAITGSPLTIANGTYITTLQADSSIAVDGLGRIWSAGYQINGLDLYDPSNGITTSFVPADNNDNYVVSTFSDGTNDYVGYINAVSASAGSAVTYGFQNAVTAVPEPASVALLLCGIAGFGIRRRRA